MEKIVLDTSAIIKDPLCLTKFGKAEIFIPITVIEELDSIKERTGEASAKARRFIQELDAINVDGLLSYPGAQVGEATVSAVMNKGDEIKCLSPDKPDNRILSACEAVASWYCGDEGPAGVTLVSEDRNLRLKARFFGFSTKGIPMIGEERKAGVRRVEGVPIGLIEELFGSAAGVDPAIIKIDTVTNGQVVLRNGSTSALATIKGDGLLYRVTKWDAYGITPRNAEQSFAMAALLDPSIQLVSLIGRAGTGKTLLALAAALEQRSKYRQIMLARPVMPMGEDVGYLPGDIGEKLKPYMQPFFDNLAVIRCSVGQGAADKIGKMLEDEKLVVEPLTYIRGRSLEKMFLIVDEAQNLTPHEVKTIVTRAGEGTKIVFTGDPDQIDHKGLSAEDNGLVYLAERMAGQALVSSVVLTKGERSELSELAAELL